MSPDDTNNPSHVLSLEKYDEPYSVVQDDIALNKCLFKLDRSHEDVRR